MSSILIAEDDPLTGRIYETCLKESGFQVELVANGLAFLARFREYTPDALLLDIMLPGLSGVEIINRIRATPSRKHLPIVAVTNAFVPALIKAVSEVGASAVLDKADLTPAKLAGTFRSLLASYPIIQTPGSNGNPKCQISEAGWATLGTSPFSGSNKRLVRKGKHVATVTRSFP